MTIGMKDELKIWKEFVFLWKSCSSVSNMRGCEGGVFFVVVNLPCRVGTLEVEKRISCLDFGLDFSFLVQSMCEFQLMVF